MVRRTQIQRSAAHREECRLLRRLLGRRLQGARERAGFSTTAAAARQGINRNTVANWESGFSEPTVSELVRLAEVYGVDPAGLLPVIPKLSGWEVRDDDEEG